MAVVLAPEPPLVDWVADIEQRIKGAGAFLVGSPVVLDLSAVKLSQSAIAHLVAELDHRGVRVMGLENTDPATAGASCLRAGRRSGGAAARVGDVASAWLVGEASGEGLLRATGFGLQTADYRLQE